jgi:hypothetical protein
MTISDVAIAVSFDQTFDNLRKGGVRSRYENFIGGKWVAPVKGRYFKDHSPVNGEPLCEIARSSTDDIERPSTPRMQSRMFGAEQRRRFVLAF